MSTLRGQGVRVRARQADPALLLEDVLARPDDLRHALRLDVGLRRELDEEPSPVPDSKKARPDSVPDNVFDASKSMKPSLRSSGCKKHCVCQ